MSARIGLRLALLALLGAFAPGHPVHAQPSPAEVQAIRSACRSDFISHCLGVQPGGREALECLASHAPQLSAACGAAVSAVTAKSDAAKGDTAEPGPQNADAEKANAQPEPAATARSPATSAPATGQSPAQELAAVSKVCTLSDVAAHCSFIAPGNPELVLCLKANATDLSPACHAVVTGLAAAPPEAAPDVAPPAAVAAPAVAARPLPAAIAAPAEPPPPAAVAAPTPSGPPPPAAAPARRPTQQQIGVIRAACRSDFISHCSGVQPGGPEALQCLERSKAEVSSRCRTALAAIAPGAPAATAEPPAAAPPSPPAEGFAIRPLRPREEFAILRLCIEEARGLCGGIPPGGGRIISCLARNASQLSPRCRAAMDEARN
jgi:hypothetical protein